MKFIEKLKTRWGIDSNLQVIIIFIVFSIAGFSIVYARKLVFFLVGIEAQDPFWLKATVWLLAVFPLYNIFLLIYGTIFGQFQFFWKFIKKAVFRFIPGKSVS
jgi:hypothetical protein